MSLNKFSQYPERTELNPTPRAGQTKLVAVTNTTTTSPSEDILVQAQDILPGVAFNSADGDPKPMISGVVWNEQEQLREAFTEGDAFTLPHFRYVADDYFWNSIVGDKCFYYLTSMDLVTWPLAWTPGTTDPALHLEWLRAPEQTQIFKFTDATPNSTWSAPDAYGNIILQNRTDAMAKVDPMDVRVNECSTSTKLKEVRVMVKSKDASPLYINFPGADVSLTIPQLPDTAVTPNVTSMLSNIKLTSDVVSDVQWRIFTLNTQATKLDGCFNVEGDGQLCTGTVWVNAPSVETLGIEYVEGVAENNCFRGDYTPGAGVPDVRVALPKLNQSLTFFENFPLKKETVLYLLQNLNTAPTPPSGTKHVLTVGIDSALTAVYGETQKAFMILDEEIQAAAEALDATGLWSISWMPVSVDGGGLTVEYQIYDYIEGNDTTSNISTGLYLNPISAVYDGTFSITSDSAIGFFGLGPTTTTERVIYYQSTQTLYDWITLPGWQGTNAQRVVVPRDARLHISRYATGDNGTEGIGILSISTDALSTTYNIKTGLLTSTTKFQAILGANYRAEKNGFRLYTTKQQDGTLIGFQIGETISGIENTEWKANLIPCKRLSDGFPGLYDTMRINTATGTHFFPANAIDAFTVHYENEQS